MTSMSRTTPRLLAIGCATPPGVLTRVGAVALSNAVAPPSTSRDLLQRFHEKSGVQSRAGVIFSASGNQSLYPPSTTEHDKGPTTQQRLHIYTQHAATLAARAAQSALTQAGVLPSRITHLVTASCTGCHAPGVDIALIDQLALSPDVRRTHIGFMGCHAAINSLATAAAISNADAAACVLVVCVELCTIHMHYGKRPDKLIANALFADGAAAVIVAHSNDTSLPHAAGFASRVFRDAQGNPTTDRMQWEITDHGFAMTLAKDVPDLLAASVPTWLQHTLRRYELTVHDIATWAIHPGGPRIVQSLVQALELSPTHQAQATADALAILGGHGNMSSATVLFMLYQMLQRSRHRPIITLAFGPGLAGEMMLLR